MYIKEVEKTQTYHRTSRLGNQHTYKRTRRCVVLRCDNCGETFERNRGDMDPKRLNNNYFHVCNNCDSKRFAQKKGTERKTVWDWNASSEIDISKI